MDTKAAITLALVIVVGIVIVWNETNTISNPAPVLVQYSCSDFSDILSLSGSQLTMGQSICTIQTSSESPRVPFSDRETQESIIVKERILPTGACDTAIKSLIENEYEIAVLSNENKVYLCIGLFGS